VEAAVAGQSVSRETLAALQALEGNVRKWTQRINLIAPSTASDIWNRHIVDSAQIFPLAPSQFAHWVDLGSGAGFPGIVVAIMARDTLPEARFTLIESDQRKSTFLRSMVREFSLNAEVLTDRIESVPPLQADVISARALADLATLMPLLHRHLAKPDGVAILHKGRRHAQEVAEARQIWRFDLEENPSMTDPDARLLTIQRIARD
jgi:16S rRNA (guanine527-N7)-methyltransferase